MNGRRIIGVFAAIVGLLLMSMFSRTNGISPSRPMGAAPANAAGKAQAESRPGMPAGQPVKAAASEEAPPRLFVADREMQVPTGLRLMVFTPHPDDEALGASGLIQRVREKDGEVQVVYITNGDGYPDGVKCELSQLRAPKNDFIEYGELRHNEAVQSLSALGLDPTSGIFLGFPDGGIDDLWSDHWSRSSPYTSPYTHSDRPPYKESPSKRLQYSGDNLQEQISRTLMDFAPDWVVLPDLRDEHPDHSATGLFVLDALRRLKEEKEEGFDFTQVFTYLIHFPDYPSSANWTLRVKTAGLGGKGTPCLTLASTQWMSLPMTTEEVEGKKRAIAAHRSQFSVLGGFFSKFSHPYEVFGRLEPQQIMLVPREYAGHSIPNS